MADWWGSIDFFEKILWYIAIPFTVLFLIQMIMTFIGMGGEGGDTGDGGDGGDGDGGDGDEDGDGDSTFRVFTVRNFIIFLTVFGWSGITLYNAGVNELLTVFLSVIIGVMVMLMVAFLFYSITRLAESGTLNINSAKGRTGEVYIPIPAKGTGVGKIQITLQGSLREMEAMTQGKAIPRGEMVKVVDVIDNRLLLVEK